MEYKDGPFWHADSQADASDWLPWRNKRLAGHAETEFEKQKAQLELNVERERKIHMHT